jgi:anti-sigma B factor antagonist
MSQDENSFAITTAQVDGTVVVRPRGEVDIATSPALRTELDACEGAVVLDLAEVTFLDSSGLGAIAATYKRLRDSFVLRNPRDNVRGAIEAVRMEHLLGE